MLKSDSDRLSGLRLQSSLDEEEWRARDGAKRAAETRRHRAAQH